MPDWLKIGARPLRWVVSAKSREKLDAYATQKQITFEKIEFWNGEWWGGSQD